jgi:hypothetical protein
MDELDDFKEIYPDSILPEDTVKWWSRYARSRNFASESEARAWIFDTLEHHDRQSYSGIFGKQGAEKNRWEADSMPIYKDRWGRVRVGRPLTYWAQEVRRKAYLRRRRAEDREEMDRRIAFHRQFPGWTYHGNKRRKRRVTEYLSNSTSDFSDGTNGEPSAPAPSTADTGTAVGLPDYKQVDRLKAKHEKLRKLLNQSQAGRYSKVSWDPRTRAGLREAEEDFEPKDMDDPFVLYQPDPDWVGYYLVGTTDGHFLGDIRREAPENAPRVEVLRQLHAEFPWIARSSSNKSLARHRTQYEAARHLLSIYTKEPSPAKDTYLRRWNELSKQNKVSSELPASVLQYLF